MLLQYNELIDKVTSSETKVSEMETAVEDLQWDIEKLRKREQKLNKHLAEALEQVSFSFISEIIQCITCSVFLLKFITIIVVMCYVLFAYLSVLPLRKEIVLQDIILQILLHHLQLTQCTSKTYSNLTIL